MADADLIRYVVYFLAGLTGIIMAEAAYQLVAPKVSGRRKINRRMVLHDENSTQKDVLIQLRKERGLDAQTTSLTRYLTELRTQAAMRMPLSRYLTITTVIAAVIGLGGGLYGGFPVVGLIATVVLMPIIPIMHLKQKRKRRLRIFGDQLAEALDLITRGLRAGHPVPVAVAMVSEEMADPIGTEFGILSDEVTYGSNMVAALEALYDRVGHDDLGLFVTAVSIQSSTGGNLRETLEGLAEVIRQRGKLRRKIKAISVEGRMSAYILSAIPALFIAALAFLSPSYYGEVIYIPLTWYLMASLNMIALPIPRSAPAPAI
ncbi:MAG: type II secretion system F family protein, partial [Pseudomonadota bacterium]